MLDRAFLRSFFDQIDSLSDESLADKIAQVEKHRSAFPRGSEASRDASFMLKHLRREMLQRHFKPPKITKE